MAYMTRVLFKVYLNKNLDAITNFDLANDITQIIEIADLVENIQKQQLSELILSKFCIVNDKIKEKIENDHFYVKIVSLDNNDIIIDDDDALHEEIHTMFPDCDENSINQ
eukprot:71357_1